MDPPARVAREIVRMIEREHTSSVIGWPEKFFARVNQLLPGMVDGALRKQLSVIRQHAASPATTRDATAQSNTQTHRKIA